MYNCARQCTQEKSPRKQTFINELGCRKVAPHTVAHLAGQCCFTCSHCTSICSQGPVNKREPRGCLCTPLIHTCMQETYTFWDMQNILQNSYDATNTDHIRMTERGRSTAGQRAQYRRSEGGVQPSALHAALKTNALAASRKREMFLSEQ